MLGSYVFTSICKLFISESLPLITALNAGFLQIHWDTPVKIGKKDIGKCFSLCYISAEPGQEQNSAIICQWLHFLSLLLCSLSNDSVTVQFWASSQQKWAASWVKLIALSTGNCTCSKGRIGVHSLRRRKSAWQYHSGTSWTGLSQMSLPTDWISSSIIHQCHRSVWDVLKLTLFWSLSETVAPMSYDDSTFSPSPLSLSSNLMGFLYVCLFLLINYVVEECLKCEGCIWLTLRTFWLKMSKAWPELQLMNHVHRACQPPELPPHPKMCELWVSLFSFFPL